MSVILMYLSAANKFVVVTLGYSNCYYKQIDLRFVSQGKVRTADRRGEQSC